jgi:Zn-dependent protease with chaperone function
MNMLFFIVSRISFLMLIYMLLDFLFGFTVRRINKGNIKFEKATALLGHEDILSAFKWLKQKFNMPNVELYVTPDYQEVNAYAIGSMRRKSITITMGLIEKIKANSENYDQYLDAVKGILGHEMSHIANSDYLPGLLAAANESANRKVAKILRWIFVIFANTFRFLPKAGYVIYGTIIGIYNMLNSLINAFYNWIFMPIYNFLRKWFGRSVEYRCDKEAAYAFGGSVVARALSMLGEGAYFSVFSTHPRTKSRINYVKNVAPKGGTIRPAFMNTLSNFLSIALVIYVCVYSTQKTDVPAMYGHYLEEVYYPAKIKIGNYQQQWYTWKTKLFGY